MFRFYLFLLLISVAFTAQCQLSGVYVFHKNQIEYRIKIVSENHHIKLLTYTNDQKKWNPAQIIKLNIEDNYIKFKNWQGITYHAYIFDNRLLLLIDLHGNTWRYSKLINGHENSQQTRADFLTEQNCMNIIPSSDFKKLVTNIMELEFDKTRLSTAKSSIRNSCISAEQAATLTSLLSFEDSKLDFAKFAYQYTYDKHNYHLVLKNFELSKNVEELNRFISQK